MFPQFASRLIRNGATLGGNLGTGSPIGDCLPVLLALDCSLVLAAREGERTVGWPTTSPATAKRSVSGDELIKTILVPLPIAPLSAFHKIAKRRFDDISSVAVAFALRLDDGTRAVADITIGLGGVAATPIRATATEEALTGRSWSRDGDHGRRRGAGHEGTPLDDHRACAVFRAAMLRQSLLKFYAQNPEAQMLEVALVSGTAVASSGRTSRSTPKVGLEHPARERRSARHRGGACTPTICSPATPVCCTPGRCRPRTRTPWSPTCGSSRRTTSPGWSGCSPPRTCPASTTPGIKHDEPLFPAEVMFYGHAVCWVLGETLEAARMGAEAVEVDYEPLPVHPDADRGDRGRESSRVTSGPSPAATPRPGWPRRPTGSPASSSSAARSTSTWRRTPRWPWSTRTARSSSSASTQHPSETQEIVAHVLGLRRPRGHRAVPADGRRLRRQGDAAARLRRDRRARRHADRPAGPAAAEPHPGHDHVRQAAPVPRQLGGRLRRRRDDHGPHAPP